MSVENNEAEQSIIDSPVNADEVAEQEQTDKGAASGEKRGEARRYWLYSPGKNAENWKDNLQRGVMNIGYGKIGNLRSFRNVQEMKDALRVQYEKRWDVSISRFANEIKKGDFVFVRQGKKFIIGYGEVASDDYIYDSNRRDYCNERKVTWERQGSCNIDLNKLHLGAQPPTLVELELQEFIEELNSKVKSGSFHDVTPADGQNNEDEEQESKAESAAQEESVHYQMELYSSMLLESKNLILHVIEAPAEVTIAGSG